MNEIDILIEKPVFQALGWALFHFLWQGALVGLGMLAANVVLKRRAAEARYAAACIALVLLLALPLITFCVLLSSTHEAKVASASSMDFTVPSQQAGSDPYLAEREPVVVPDTSAVVSEPTVTLPGLNSWVQSRFASLIPWIISIWLLGVVVLSGRFVGGLVVAERLKRADRSGIPEEWQGRFTQIAARLRVSRPVRLCQSALVQVPTVIGWLRPVVLLPASALTGLSREQLEALLAHELAHVRRHDYIINILQTAAETLLFYHPAVWWVSGQARIERENCCDDLAVGACGDVLTYARALTQLETLRKSSPQLAMAASGGSLIRRIERLVGIRPPSGGHKFAPTLAALGVLVMVPILTAAAGGALARHSALASDKISSGSNLAADDVMSAPEAASAGRADAHDSQAGADAEEAHPETEGTAATATDQPAAATSSTPTTTNGLSGAAETQDSTARSYIDDLSAAGLTNLTVDDLIRLKTAGVTGDYIRTLKQAGLVDLSINKLVELRMQGVTPEYIKEMSDSGYPKLSTRELIELRIQGITGEYIRSMVSLYTDVTLRSLIEMKIQGVDANYVHEMAAAGYDHLTARDAVSLKIQGVTAEYVKEMKSIGLEGLSPRTLTSLKAQGVTAEYAREMRSLGADTKSARDLISLRVSGVTPEYVKAMQGAGLGSLTIREIVSMSLQGVSEEYVKEMKAAGFENLTSRQLVEMRVQGVDAEYVKQLKSAGFSNLSVREIVELKTYGVDVQFMKRMQEHGFKNLTARQLIQLKIAGID